MNSNETNDQDVSDELVAAEAEFLAAQEMLAAAKIRLAELKERDSASKSFEDDHEMTDRADGDAVVGAATQEEGAPTWVPYTTTPASQPPRDAAAPTYDASYAQTCGASQTPNPVPPPPGANAGYYQPQPPSYEYQQQSYQQQPYQHSAVSSKDHVAAGLLAIFLGTFGIHKFYLGYNTAGFIMLAVTIIGSIFTFGLAGGVVWIIAIIEGILYLTKSQSEFEQVYVINKRDWF